MDPNDPTTPVDNPADVVADVPVDPTGTGDGTGDKPTTPTEPSKSDDADAAAGGDDKSKPKAGEPDAAKDTPAPFDSDLDDWIEKKGLAKPENDEQKKAYQDFRNSQREFTRTQQAKKDSEKLGDAVKGAADDLKPKDGDDDDDDSVEARLARVEADRVAERNLRLQSEFYTENKVSPDEHKTLLEVFSEKIDKAPTQAAKLKALEYWGSPEALPDLLDIAKARLAKATDTSEVEDKAAQEERARIAKESNAHSPSRSAKNNNPSDKTPEEERTERLKARYSSSNT